MHRLAPALLALALTACASLEGDSDHSDHAAAATCGDACKATEEAFGLDQRTVHHAHQQTFTSGGVAYTLVRVEYGDTEECDLAGDCSYSTYCGFVVDGKPYPLEVSWVTDEDALFDPAQYCEGGELAGCELPGQTLPILDDEDFEDWIYDTDPEDDPLVECFADYW
jgi:hypothetical protein